MSNIYLSSDCNDGCNNKFNSCSNDCDKILADAHQQFAKANQMHAKSDSLLSQDVRSIVCKAIDVLQESNYLRKEAIDLEENTEWYLDQTNCGLNQLSMSCSRLGEATAYEYGKEDAYRKELVRHLKATLDLIDDAIEVDSKGDIYKQRYTDCIHSC